MATKTVKTKSAAAATTPAAAASVETRRLVVCAYPGTEDRMARVWRKMTGETPLVMTVEDGRDILDVITDAVADTAVAGDFILVPANCVPCCPMSMEELSVPLVFVDVSGRRHFNDRLPLPLGKDSLVEELVAAAPSDGETFLASYFKKHLHRPIEGGFRFGNLVTPVYRANPCENLVIEAFVRKRFLTATPAGFAAVAGLIDRFLLA